MTHTHIRFSWFVGASFEEVILPKSSLHVSRIGNDQAFVEWRDTEGGEHAIRPRESYSYFLDKLTGESLSKPPRHHGADFDDLEREVALRGRDAERPC